jgi:hypothetical protein
MVTSEDHVRQIQDEALAHARQGEEAGTERTEASNEAGTERTEASSEAESGEESLVGGVADDGVDVAAFSIEGGDG